MPKGVEHVMEKPRTEAVKIAPTSVMPKGVEHRWVCIDDQNGARAHLCDAERR